MADSTRSQMRADLRLGIADGNRCAAVKDSLDLVECINSQQSHGRGKANNASAYDAGIMLAAWRLQDSILNALVKLDQTESVRQASKVSDGMTIVSFVAAQKAIRTLGLSDDEVLDAADFEAQKARWSHWARQPLARAE